jgi:hypothetical protein
MILNDENLADIHRRKSRFIGQWTGTAGSLAADCHHLMEDRKEMAATIDTLQQDNAKLRAAVEARIADSCCDGGQCHPAAVEEEPDTIPIPVDWIIRGQRELEKSRTVRFKGDGILAAEPDQEAPPAERLLLDALTAVRDRRAKYGPPRDHFAITVALINARYGTSFKPQDWATIMQLDKIARSAGPGDHHDNDVDGAGYAACRAEVREP